MPSQLGHSSTFAATAIFIVFFAFRYLRFAVGIYANLTYKPVPIPKKPTIGPKDFTVIIPTTFKRPAELVECIRNVIACSPAALLIVTSDSNVTLVKTLCAVNSFDVLVLGVEKLNKRTQMLAAVKHVQTLLVAFADDDVFWPNTDYLRYLAAIFENPKVGAGGTRQRTRRENPPGAFNFLGISYLERRVFNNITTNAIDGSLSTLSGRTAAFRTEILTDPEFLHHFVNDMYKGQRLNSDDDKCLTRWVYSHGWEIKIQSHPEAILETTLESDWDFIAQCHRWERSSRRGNLTVMSKESYWWQEHWFGLYAIYISMWAQVALLNDGVLIGLLWAATSDSAYRNLALSLLGTWIFFTKIAKLIPHFLKYPADLRFIPVSILFSYLHGIIRVKCLFTLTDTAWSGKDLKKLENARAKNGEVVPLLRNAEAESGLFREPTPGRLMEGEDYFSATPLLPARRR